jgi:hypothetical protein
MKDEENDYRGDGEEEAQSAQREDRKRLASDDRKSVAIGIKSEQSAQPGMAVPREELPLRRTGWPHKVRGSGQKGGRYVGVTGLRR